MAPGAQLYLANFSTDVEWANAVNWLISQDVDIISCSISWYLSGPGNGTGPINDSVAAARAAGITWAQSAGNYAQSHWSGVFLDSDNDSWNNFSGVDETNAVSASAGDTITVQVRWDDTWGASSNDYDIYLANNAGTIVAGSENTQSGSGYYPREWFSYSVPTSGTYHIVYVNTLQAGMLLFI
jgi:hypothetical protein